MRQPRLFYDFIEKSYKMKKTFIQINDQIQLLQIFDIQTY